MTTRIEGTRRVGSIAFDPAALTETNAAILKLPMTHIYDGVGDYMLSHLWYGEASENFGLPPDASSHVPYIAKLMNEIFQSKHIVMARIFAARRGGYIRPHRDFYEDVAPWTRVHIPLQTNPKCLSSEDEIVFHMDVGEIWLFDGGRPHSGGAFSNAMRLHLVIDFAPDIPIEHLFRDKSRCRVEQPPSSIARPPLSRDHLNAIYGLSEIATEANFLHISDLLGTLHFERRVGCAAAYEWMIEIGRRSGDPKLLQRAEELQSINIRAALADPPSRKAVAPAIKSG